MSNTGEDAVWFGIKDVSDLLFDDCHDVPDGYGKQARSRSSGGAEAKGWNTFRERRDVPYSSRLHSFLDVEYRHSRPCLQCQHLYRQAVRGCHIDPTKTNGMPPSHLTRLMKPAIALATLCMSTFLSCLLPQRPRAPSAALVHEGCKHLYRHIV